MNLFFIFLVSLFSVTSCSITKDYSLVVEKGHSYSFQIYNKDLTTTVLVYCSSDNTMKINDEYSSKFQILKFNYYKYEKIYQIDLQSKSYSYIFKVIFLPNDVNAEYGDFSKSFISIEIFNDYDFNSMSLIFIHSELDKSIDSMLNVRLKAGNPIQAYYIPLSDDLDINKLGNDINYKLDAPTGEIFHPKDEYFIIKVVGSTYDFMVEYFAGSINKDYTRTIHLFSDSQYLQKVSNGYSQYKIDYITGSKEDCKVDIRKKFNNSEYTIISTLSKNNKRIILDIEELNLISYDCDAVLTVITNYIYNYKKYSLTEDVVYFKLPNEKISLFQIPKPQYNIRAFRFEMQKAYDFGTQSGCPSFNIGIISMTNSFIEEPVKEEYIFEGGKSKFFYILNPYFYPNEAEKNNEEYYVIITNNCYAVDPFMVTVMSHTLDETKIGYLEPRTDHPFSFYGYLFDNFYSIDGPKDNKKVFSYRISSCQNKLKFYILTDYNAFGISSIISGESTGYITLDDKKYQKDFLNVFFRKKNDKAYFKYEYYDIIDNYKPNYARLPFTIKVENSYNEKINVEFYPLAFDEDVKYQLYIIQTTDNIYNMCNFLQNNAKYKAYFDIGVFNVPQNAQNYLLKKEVKLGYGPNIYKDLKISIVAKTSKYGSELMYPSVDFVYNPKYKDDDKDEGGDEDDGDKNHNTTRKDSTNISIFTNIYFYIGIGAVIIFIVAAFICHAIKKKKSDDNFDLPRDNSKLLNY